MLQEIKETVNSTLVDFDGSLERDILSALSIVVKTPGSWFLSLLNEEKKKKKKCLKMETQEAVKQIAQTTNRICLGLLLCFIA